MILLCIFIPTKPLEFQMKKISLIIIIGSLLLCVAPLTIWAQKPPPQLKFGKYACTAGKYRNGAYEYIPRGSFTITKNGPYTYLGFEKPSTGKYTIDKVGNLLFTGGYLDKGKAEKIDRPDKFFLVFPTNPDNRWTCTCAEK